MLPYCQYPLDRADAYRDSAESLLQHGELQVLPMQRGCIGLSPDQTSLHWLHGEACRHRLPSPGAKLIFLGLEPSGAPRFLWRLDNNEAWPEDDSPTLFELRQAGPLLKAQDAAIAIGARALDQWHERVRYCSACGGHLLDERAGHQKRCESCGHHDFPRIDPAVIMLVTHGEGADARCLLGHNARFPDGVYSTLAGFVEAGESLEDAVRREVQEEAGIQVDNVQYSASQPWPFPRSIMLGFRASAVSEHITVDGIELSAAHWFSRRDLEAFGEWGGDAALQMPRRDSIARFLIDQWITGNAAP